MKTTLIAALMLVLASGPAHSHTDVTPAHVRAWMDTASSGVIVDVREEIEFCDSTYNPPDHIPGSINMPWNSGYFLANYTDLPADEEIIIVCRSGNRSNQAANFLDAQGGYNHVFDMLGGMNEWTYETESCPQAGIPGSHDPDVRPLALAPAVPNPFTSSTEIAFMLPESQGDLSLKIYDARGRSVVTLLDGTGNSVEGRVTWNGTDQRGHEVTSGVYFSRLTWRGNVRMRRIVLLR